MDSKPKASVLKTKLNQRELFRVNLKVILIWNHSWYPISDNCTLRCIKSLYEALYWRVTLKSTVLQQFCLSRIFTEGAWMGQGCECSPPTTVAQVWFLDLVFIVGTCPCSKGKKQLSKFQFHLETTEKKCHPGGISFA